MVRAGGQVTPNSRVARGRTADTAKAVVGALYENEVLVARVGKPEGVDPLIRGLAQSAGVQRSCDDQHRDVNRLVGLFGDAASQTLTGNHGDRCDPIVADMRKCLTAAVVGAPSQRT